jgi:hypothetical protein
MGTPHPTLPPAEVGGLSRARMAGAARWPLPAGREGVGEGWPAGWMPGSPCRLKTLRGAGRKRPAEQGAVGPHRGRGQRVDMGEVLRLPRCARSLGMTGCCLGGQLPPRGQPLIVASGWALLTWQNETGLAIRAGRRPAKNPRRCRRRRGHPQAGRVPFPVNEKRPAPGRPFQESGKRDSNPRRSAWEFPSRPSRPALPRSITGSPSPARPVESRYSE